MQQYTENVIIIYINAIPALLKMNVYLVWITMNYITINLNVFMRRTQLIIKVYQMAYIIFVVKPFKIVKNVNLIKYVTIVLVVI